MSAKDAEERPTKMRKIDEHSDSIEESPSNKTANVHPLLLDPVLDRLFLFCPASALAACRLVCTIWYDQALRSWRNKARLTLLPERFQRLREFRHRNWIPYQNYESLNEDYNLEGKPFRTLRVKQMHPGTESENDATVRALLAKCNDLELSNVPGMTLTNMRELLLQIVPHITTLKFTNVPFDNLIGSEGCLTLSSILQKYPETHDNLRRFEYTGNIGAWGNVQRADIILGWVMSRAKNLEFVSVRFVDSPFIRLHGVIYDSSFNYLHFKILLYALVGELRGLQKIKKLDLMNLTWTSSTNITDRWIDQFHAARMSLEELSMDLGRDTSPTRIAKLMAPYHATLKKLHIYRVLKNANPENAEVDSVVLENLERLQIGEGLNDALLFLSVVKTPNLKTLILENPSSKKSLKRDWRAVGNPFWGPPPPWTLSQERLSTFWLQRTELGNVQTLDLKHLRPMYVFTSAEVRDLGRSMPNVQELSLPAGKESFAAICETWKKLTSLRIYGGANIALPKGELIDDQAIVGRWRPMITDINYVGNVKDLVDLMYFTLEHQGNWNNLTDISVFHGFLKLPILRSIIMPFNHVSERGKEALAKKGVYVQDLLESYIDPLIRERSYTITE